MDDFIYYSELFDLYKNMLTKKQRKTFKDYFFENLTLEEIAENEGVSKNAISKTIKNIKKLLNDYEDALHLKEYLINIKDEFKNELDILHRLEKYDNIIM